MAYKFQLGSFTASGSIKAEEGFDAADQNITNVGDLALDSLSADGNELQISLTDNQADALVIGEGANDYLKFSTSDSGEGILASKPLRMNTNTKLELRNSDTTISSEVAGEMAVNASSEVQLKVGGSDVAVADSSGLAVTGTLTVSTSISASSFLSASAISLDDASGLAGNGLADSSGALQLDIANLTELAHADVVAEDEMIISDAGTVKKVGVDSLGDFYYGRVSGDATIADGGALTIAAGAVEHGMLAEDIISGQSELAHADILAADDLMIHDSANSEVKKVGVDSLGDFFYGRVSGDATIADGGALTIANAAVETAMLNENVISGQDQLLAAQISGSYELMISDGSALKRADAAHLGDFIFSNVSGDATIASGGALTLAANAVEGSMINSNAAGDGLKYGSNALNIEPNDFAGTGLEDDGSDNLAVSAAQTSITSILNDSFGTIGRAGSANDLMDFGTAGQIDFKTNNTARFSVMDSMIQSTVGFDSGGDIQIPAAGAFDVAAAGNLDVGPSVGANNLTLGGSSSTVVIPGNLTVQGTTVTVDSTNILVTGSISFEGATGDAFETTLGVVDPTADRAINLADVAGTLIPFAAASTTAIAATPAELNLLDGDVAVGSSITIEDGDGIIIDDGGTMKKIPASDLKGLVGSLQVAAKADSDSLEADKVNYFADLSANATVTLPASDNALIGKSVYIKAKNLTSGAQIIINTQASGQKVDGADMIVLESPYAAVRLIYVAADDWRVF